MGDLREAEIQNNMSNGLLHNNFKRVTANNFLIK